jgi:5-formyltetrahydrofolate cyclo-ligase
MRRKAELRRLALAARRAQPDKDECSRKIWEAVVHLPAFQRARTVMCYVHVRDEVRTQFALPQVLEGGRQIVIPYCAGDELELFRLQSLDELEPRTLGILEPRKVFRDLDSRRVAAESLDVVLVPGLAFDRRGARLGYGKGYYDRLLRRVRPDALKLGIAFQCQLFPEVPTLDHDVLLDAVLTERGLPG